MCKKRLAERPFGKVNGKEVEGRSGNTKLKANKVGATGWWPPVRNIKPWEVTEAFINDWNQDAAKQMVSESIANQQCKVGKLVWPSWFFRFYFWFCFFLLLKRLLCGGGWGEKEEESRAGVKARRGEGRSVEGHFVPCLIFVFTWHGRKLPMKGGSDYCLINTEAECPHLLKRIRSENVWIRGWSEPSRWEPLLQHSSSSLWSESIHHNCVFFCWVF